MTAPQINEGLGLARFVMVLSSLSPLFILWGIRGTPLISDYYFTVFCASMVIVPNLFLFWRIETAKRLKETRDITIGIAEDHREHLLVYLFSMLLPFYAESLAEWRHFASVLAALAFIAFLFWHLHLHYMNLVFALMGYRVFTVYPPTGKNRHSGKTSFAVITKRVSLPAGETLTLLRLSDTVFMETSQ